VDLGLFRKTMVYLFWRFKMNISQLDQYCKMKDKIIIVHNGKLCGYSIKNKYEEINWETADLEFLE